MWAAVKPTGGYFEYVVEFVEECLDSFAAVLYGHTFDAETGEIYRGE